MAASPASSSAFLHTPQLPLSAWNPSSSQAPSTQRAEEFKSFRCVDMTSDQLGALTGPWEKKNVLGN